MSGKLHRNGCNLADLGFAPWDAPNIKDLFLTAFFFVAAKNQGSTPLLITAYCSKNVRGGRNIRTEKFMLRCPPARIEGRTALPENSDPRENVPEGITTAMRNGKVSLALAVSASSRS